MKRRLELEGEHSYASSAQDKNDGAISPLTHTLSACGASLIKHNFSLAFYRSRKPNAANVAERLTQLVPYYACHS
jgi:hypothetical protein